ncbi:MAG: methyltransferase domain-containing protein [Chloroflexi bacterium]|nr:methyltransferase domain-containing protein [Chloroflexota bacterium]
MNNRKQEISQALYHVSNTFGQSAKDTILYENHGKHVYEIDMILSHMEESSRLLDLGGGLGVNLLCIRQLLGSSVELHLVDRFDEYTEHNRMGTHNVGLELMEKAGISITNQDFWTNPNLPYTGNYFDIVTCFDVVEHLPGHPLTMLREISRIINRRGIFILGGPNSVSLTKRAKLLFGRHPYSPFSLWCSDQYFSHYREYSQDEYRFLLNTSGFQHIKTTLTPEPSATRARTRFFNGKRHGLSTITLSFYCIYILEKLFTPLREGIYCSARKLERHSIRN